MSARVGIDNYFVQVPDWITDSSVSDGAYRLYAVLTTYARQGGSCYPSRSTLAKRLRKSDRSIDGYLKELIAADAVKVRKRRNKDNRKMWDSNEYMLITAPPKSTEVAKQASLGGEAGFARGGEESCAEVAKQASHEPEVLNQNKHNQKKSGAEGALFEGFWAAYPATRKGGKHGTKGAHSAYTRLAKELTEQGILDRLEHYKRTRAKAERSGEFVPTVPYATTWLNQHRWDDFGEYKPGPVELTADEVNQILGPDHWAPESPDGGFQTVEEELEWRQAAYAARLEERKQRAKEVMTGGTVRQDS